MYEKFQKLILGWNALESLVREAEEQKDADTMVSIHIGHFVKNDGEITLCEYVFVS
jgi:hypothetical protein